MYLLDVSYYVPLFSSIGLDIAIPLSPRCSTYVVLFYIIMFLFLLTIIINIYIQFNI